MKMKHMVISRYMLITKKIVEEMIIAFNAAEHRRTLTIVTTTD